MNMDDFLKLVGASDQHDGDLVPVACLLKSAQAVAGYFNGAVNSGLADTVVLVGVRLVDLGRERAGSRRVIDDFTEFLEQIVARCFAHETEGAPPATDETLGRSVPLAAVPLEEIAMLYPVARIAQMLGKLQAEQNRDTVPSFLDLSRSEILRLLRLKLW